MEEEFIDLQKNNTWELVPFFDDMNLIRCKWVFRIKYNSDGSVLKYKVRLVAKGFLQNSGIDYVETFSLVVKAPTIRVLFSLAVTFGWDVQQVDVNNAFLNGDLEEEVFMSQRDGFVSSAHPSHVCKLKKFLYRLKQAPRAWYTKLRNALQSWGFLRAVSDASLFIKRTSTFVIFILVYVDILITGSDFAALQACIHDLDTHFALKTIGSVNYFLGFKAYRDSNGLYLTQSKYVLDLLKKAAMSNCNSCETPFDTVASLTNEGELFANPSLYRTLVGSLQYLTYTWPNIAFGVNKLSQFLANPK